MGENVRAWVSKTTKHQRKALNNAAKAFDSDDGLSVHDLEAMYGQESSWGTLQGDRGNDGPAGGFQMTKDQAGRRGLTVTDKNDERFDIDHSSLAAAERLKEIDDGFRRGRDHGGGLHSQPVEDAGERRAFDFAAYNGGEARVAKAQRAAKTDGKDPSRWDDVKEYLEKAGASTAKAEEIRNYVDKLHGYSREFEQASKTKDPADEEDPKQSAGESMGDGHWVTIDDHPVLIEE